MFAFGVNNYKNSGDFRNKSMMCSEVNNFYTSALNQRYGFERCPNAISSQSVNENTRVKQYQQHNMLEENMEKNPKCIVKYNTDQQSYLYGEFYNRIPVRKNYIPYENSRLQNQVPLSYTRKTSLKSTLKRRRTNFTTEQIIALEEVFKKRPYVHRDERIELMNKLHINETSIKVWFQNRRRLSDNRMKDYNLDSPLSENTTESISDRITMIESYVKQNSDENGYVTLDDETMGNLVDIIDECLPQDINFEKTPTEPVTSDEKLNNLCDNKPIYEPISPVSLSEHSETQDENVTFDNQDLLLGISDYYYL